MKVIPEMHTKFDIYVFFFFIPKTFKSFCFPTFLTMSIPDIQSFELERTWCRLFQKCILNLISTFFFVFVFSSQRLLNRFAFQPLWLWAYLMKVFFSSQKWVMCTKLNIYVFITLYFKCTLPVPWIKTDKH
jgi:hypothetical protein